MHEKSSKRFWQRFFKEGDIELISPTVNKWEKPLLPDWYDENLFRRLEVLSKTNFKS